MSTFLEKELKLIDELNPHDNILMVRRPIIEIEEPKPKLYLLPDSEEYYWCSSSQITMYPKKTGCSITDVLNEDGVKYYNQIRDVVLKSEPNAIFEVYCLHRALSGSWFADKTSKWYRTHEPLMGYLNSHENFVVFGRVKGTKQWLTTSVCIFIVPEENWCMTINHSYYKLEKQISYDEYLSMQKLDKKKKKKINQIVL